MPRKLSLLAVLQLSALLTGCGAMGTRHEAELYHQTLEADAKADYVNCRSGRATSFAQHQWGSEWDCFDLVVRQSPQRVPSRARDQFALNDPYAVVDRFALMALFSKMVYHRYEDVDDRSSQEACSRNAPDHPINALYLGEGAKAAGRWELWDNGGKGCLAKGGLYYETYVFYPSQAARAGFTQAVIVFRGTENFQSQRYEDWSDNLKAAFNIVPDQYEKAYEQVPKVVASLDADEHAAKDEKGQSIVTIWAAGHSLGGGLAQLAAYASPRIKAAYAFNSSPVTGWTWMHEKARTEGTVLVRDPQIYRVWQSGEGLQILRRVSTAFNSDRFGRSDYEFDFRIRDKVEKGGVRQEVRNLVHEHDIGLLACNMALRVVLARNGAVVADADFAYTKEMALNVLSQADRIIGKAKDKDEQLCTNAVLTEIGWRPAKKDAVLTAGR